MPSLLNFIKNHLNLLKMTSTTKAAFEDAVSPAINDFSGGVPHYGGDWPYREPEKETPLQTAFQNARRKGHDFLLEAPYVELDMGASLLSLHDTYRPQEAFISMKKDDVPTEALKHIFQKGGKIAGIYDLSRMFQYNSAKIGIDGLPPAINAAIRDGVFDRIQPTLPIWQKALLLSESRKSTYKANLAI